MMEQIVFYSLSFLILISSIGVISLNNPIYNALCLVSAFMGAAGLYLMLEAEFLAMALIIVYVGAVCVFFLFVIITLEKIDYEKIDKISWKKKALGIFLGIVFASEMSLIVISKLNFSTIKSQKDFNLKGLSIALFQEHAYLLEVMGVILLIAMIGSIVITKNTNTPHEKLKNQNASVQNMKSRAQSVKLVKVEFRKGIK
jgi:NADH-quinone oxidoreductase subunit J